MGQTVESGGDISFQNNQTTKQSPKSSASLLVEQLTKQSVAINLFSNSPEVVKVFVCTALSFLFYWHRCLFCFVVVVIVVYQQARKLQATLEGCNPKLSLTYSLADRGKV